MTRTEVTRTYVELLDARELRLAEAPRAGLSVERAEPCPADLYRFLYSSVGARYHWVDRLPWSDEEIEEHVGQPSISIWVLRDGRQPAGYFELARHDDRSVEIAYLGLLDAFTGEGLGKYLLSAAVRQAWAPGASRVWLHTCTLDHPAALPNYLARGFRVFKTETYSVER